MNADTLVSVGLPVRNAGVQVEDVVRSVLAQDHGRLELVISDNASTDETEEVCRDLAQSDSRIVYHRQPENVGLLNNFRKTIELANGGYFRWIGDDDRLEPRYVSRCLEVLTEDPRLILATTQIAYRQPDGAVASASYEGRALGSDDPVERFEEMLRLLNESYLLIDPMYGMMRRARVVTIPRRNMLREDELFALKLSLAGPWAHLPEMLAFRNWKHERIGTLARRLDVPSWQSHLSVTLLSREILRWLPEAGLTAEERRQARRGVYQMYLRRQRRTAVRRGRKLLRLVLARSSG